MTTQEYFSWFNDVLRTTEGMYRLVPSDKLDWKPTENSFTLGQLVEHMPRAFWFNSKVIASEEWPLKSMREILVTNRRHPSASADEALVHLVLWSNEFKQAVQNLGDEKFQRADVNSPQWGTLPIWRFAVFVLEHHLNHKMELHMYLKLLGVTVNTKILYVGEGSSPAVA
jgi:uncharacterized damage-inducible protein DinB